MKAIARLFILLVMFTSFTGFSTTTDSSQNPDAFSIQNYDVVFELDNAIVVILLDFNANINESKNSNYVIFNIYSQNQLLKHQVNKGARKYIPPLSSLNRNFDIYNYTKLKSNPDILYFRRARDGISYK